MKKKFIFIIGFLLCNFCFSSIVIQNEFLLGVKTTHIENCFNITDPVKNTKGFTFGALTNCMWEFGTKNTQGFLPLRVFAIYLPAGSKSPLRTPICCKASSADSLSPPASSCSNKPVS